MSIAATITVTSGPDRGKVYQIEEELVHLGRSPENQIVLNDPDVSDQQATIVRRNGRYAIYTPLDEAVEVDGSTIPSQRWVWLPDNARIRVSERTALKFHIADDGAAAVAGDGSDATPRSKSSQSGREKRSSAKGSSKKGRNVARFVTDQQGDHLVTLGEDGQLPELSLSQGRGRSPAEKPMKTSNSILVYAAVVFSFCFSIAMLLIDATPSASAATERARARIAIVEFHGGLGEEIQPYQRLLREARLAHSRNDQAAEHQAYRRILELLNSEDNDTITGLTGSPEDDELLRKLISVLLSR